MRIFYSPLHCNRPMLFHYKIYGGIFLSVGLNQPKNRVQSQCFALTCSSYNTLQWSIPHQSWVLLKKPQAVFSLLSISKGSRGLRFVGCNGCGQVGVPDIYPVGVSRAKFDEILAKAKALNCGVISVEPGKQPSRPYVTYRCNVHTGYSHRERSDAFLSRETPYCCYRDQGLTKLHEELSQYLKHKNYKQVGPMPARAKDPIVITCLNCNETSNTTFVQLKRNTHGIRCCGNAAAALQRIVHGMYLKGQRPKGIRGTHMTRWRNRVYRAWSNTCPLSGTVLQYCIHTGVRQKVQAHHLYSAAVYPSVMHNTENGILLSHEIHETYHRFNNRVGKPVPGFSKKVPATAETFILFLEWLLQTPSERIVLNIEQDNLIKTLGKVKDLKQVSKPLIDSDLKQKLPDS